MLVKQYLLLMIQNYTFQLLLFQRKIMKILLNNNDFIEQQNKGFQRSIYWNEYKTKKQTVDSDNNNANIVRYISLDPSFQGVNRLFVMA